MKFSALLLSSLATGSIAVSIPRLDLTISNAAQRVFDGFGEDREEASSERFFVELGPGEQRWITEEEKWALKRKGINFMDITEYPDLGSSAFRSLKAVTFPEKPAYASYVKPLLKHLSKEKMRTHLEKFTSFHTRYYKSSYGAQSAAWLASTINSTIHASNASSSSSSSGPHVSLFPHSWGQPSIIVTLPGKGPHTVVVGAHQDSINLFFPSLLAAPGADDDGSGTVTILEALRVLLNTSAVSSGEQRNTVEFHWYSAEEGGLLGSQAVFARYEKEGRQVKAMLQQDMTGYIKGTLDAGKPESVGVVTDFVDSGLTSFVKKVIEEYCDIPYIETKCGYACSDHASASKAGYPSAFVIESSFESSDHKIHTTQDKIEYLSFEHMLQHAKLTLGLAYELAQADFD